MDLTDLHSRTALPEALRVLVHEMPREMWQDHPDFAGLVAFWLDRHAMFRRLFDLLQQDARALADGQIDPSGFGARLSRMGGMLISQLHGHHQIEDHHYSPFSSGSSHRWRVASTCSMRITTRWTG